MKLFSKDIDPCCIYCAWSRPINDEQVVCVKQGVVSSDYRCRKYKYDATKRIPPEPTLISENAFSAEDFKI